MSNHIAGTDAPVSGMHVSKVGHASGLTVGRVVDGDSTQYIDAENGLAPERWTKTILVECTKISGCCCCSCTVADRSQNFSIPGDSGAVYVSDERMVIGLNMAGGGGVGIGCRIDEVQARLKITINATPVLPHVAAMRRDPLERSSSAASTSFAGRTASAGAPPRADDDSLWATMQRRLDESPMGHEIGVQVRRHLPEAIELVNHNRAVMVALAAREGSRVSRAVDERRAQSVGTGAARARRCHDERGVGQARRRPQGVRWRRPQNRHRPLRRRAHGVARSIAHRRRTHAKPCRPGGSVSPRSIEELKAEEARVRAVLDGGADAQLRAIPGVVHVSVGLKQINGTATDEYCIRVYVARKKAPRDVPASEVIPKRIQGIATDVNEVRVVKAIEDTAKYRPLTGGCEITNNVVDANGLIGVGTLGCFATDNTDGGTVLLTNFHVIGGTAGVNVFQPATAEAK